KISAQLQQAKAQLGELEARAKGKMAQGEIDAINHLKAKHQEIEKKRQELKTVGDAKVEQVKAEIDAHVTKLKARWRNSPPDSKRRTRRRAEHDEPGKVRRATL